MLGILGAIFGNSFAQKIFVRSKPDEPYKPLEGVELFEQCPGEGEVIRIRVDDEVTEQLITSDIDSDEDYQGHVETYVVKKVKTQLRFRRRPEDGLAYSSKYHRQSRKEIYLELITVEKVGCPKESFHSKK